MMSQVVPVTAGEIRRGGFSSPFNKHVGIEGFTSTNTNKGAIAINVITPETASNIHRPIVHGGWTATLLDTVASSVPYFHKVNGLEDSEYGLTKSLNIEFNKPVFVGQTYSCQGNIIERKGNNIKTEAALTDAQGVKVATATALVKARRADYETTTAMAV